ncbi:MAG TPA: polyprenyl synthetase family protein [Actinomycetota bacterium]|nr:polyprenyl synthetase family protein [Actinomycetota bacterium]
MTAPPAPRSEVLGPFRPVVDEALEGYLAECSADLTRRDVRAGALVDEIARLVRAGGKRLRPAFCFWGYRAAGPAGPAAIDVGEPIVRAASALELLHTMALIHDDLMDEATERRGVPSSASRLTGLAADRGLPADHLRFGRSAALLAGDLAAVLGDRLLLTSGFDPQAIARALVPYHEMRIDMAAGQFLDVAGTADGLVAASAARLKGGSYTVEGPLLVGAALAGDRDDVREALRAFGAPLGEAFQLRDDLLDGEALPGVAPSDVNALVDRARAALRDAPIDPDAAAGLDGLASLVAMA